MDDYLKSRERIALNRTPLKSLRQAVFSKRFVSVLVLIQLLLLNVWSGSASAAPAVQPSLQLDARAGLLMDADSGQILYQMNADVPNPPASMAKMMTEYLVSKAVKEGKLSWDQKVKVDENASLQIGSRIYLAEGDEHTLRELYIAMAVGSANDATAQLAATVAGSEEGFAKLMNETAKKLGLKETYFINATGLDRADMPEKYRPTSLEGETTMSARDAATLAFHILKEDPEFLEIAKIPTYQFREGKNQKIVNWNWMLEAFKAFPNFRKFAYEGVDGLKTGHTTRAGNNFTGTALRSGTRLIAVVMGVPGGLNDGKRFLETAKLFDYGFNNFEKKTIIDAKASITGYEKLPVKKGKSKSVSVVTAKDLTILAPKGQEIEATVQEVKSTQEPLMAPIKTGDKVGTATYTYKDPSTQEAKTVAIDLIAAEDVNKANWFQLLFRAIGDFFAGLFKGIVGLF
jgi:serine-type D-Ala-D-Ala carboxypeptidase (penicillin-binding protein 5/6)